MTLPLRLVTVPDPFLRQQVPAITVFDDHLRQIASDMLRVMQQQDGVGLAANQVGFAGRLFVYGVAEPFRDGGVRVPRIEPRAIINPVLTPIGTDTSVLDEGCLSIPDIHAPVRRANRIRLQAQTLKGEPIDETVEGYEARIIQHETDHLNGVLFLDLVTDPTTIYRSTDEDE